MLLRERAASHAGPAPHGRSRMSPDVGSSEEQGASGWQLPKTHQPSVCNGSLLAAQHLVCQRREGHAPASATSAQLSCRGLWRAALLTARRWRSQEEAVPTESSQCAQSTPWWQTPERNSPGRRQAGGLRRFDVSAAPAMSWPQPPDSHGRRPWGTQCSRKGRSRLPAVGRAPGWPRLERRHTMDKEMSRREDPSQPEPQPTRPITSHEPLNSDARRGTRTEILARPSCVRRGAAWGALHEAKEEPSERGGPTPSQPGSKPRSQPEVPQG